MNVDSYLSVVGKRRMLLTFNDIEEFITAANKSNITRIRGKFEVDGTVQDMLKGRVRKKQKFH